MDQVLTPAGTVNPNETFYTDTFRNYTIHGNFMMIGTIAQVSLSLLHTYHITNDQSYVLKAQDLLDALSAPANPLGMWDPTNLGYFESIAFSGQTAQQPGTVSVNTGKKEAGRQILMLWAYHLANHVTNNRYQQMENDMLTIALTKAYYPQGHGVLYEMRPDWSLVTINGIPEDWVTTEAMGAELESLFSLGIYSPSLSPTQMLSPTSPGNKNTSIELTVNLHGIGTGGDNVNPNSIGNRNPSHQTRSVQITIYNTKNEQLINQQGTILYNQTHGNFTGTISVSGLPNGQYIFAVKADGYLEKRIEDVISVTEGQPVTLPAVTLVTGDITNDNVLNILDYNALISCYGSAQTNPNYHCLYPITDQSPGADITDDKIVDGIDYNLFIRELSVQIGY